MSDNQETCPCGLCGKPTPMLGTRRCDACWELERRVQAAPSLALLVLARMGYVVAPREFNSTDFPEGSNIRAVLEAQERRS